MLTRIIVVIVGLLIALGIMNYYFKSEQVNDLQSDVANLSDRINRLGEQHAKELDAAKELACAKEIDTSRRLPVDPGLNETTIPAKAQIPSIEDSIALRKKAAEVFAREAVKAQLKDPDSAQIAIVKGGITSKGADFICGQVNAMNAMGGSTGFSRFIWSFGGPVLSERAGELPDTYKKLFDYAWESTCG